MTTFINPFDAALDQADDAIIRDMGIPALITTGALAGTTITGIYDDPESITMVAGGIRLEDSTPSLFVRTADVLQLRRQDVLNIGGELFSVDRITPDDGGSCHLRLRRSSAPETRRAELFHERS
ncbi:TPA: phage tail protein [Escherichia coli]|nr:head-tail joining protein [Escherichia coli]HAY0219012.1 phage tail protein [Escherichia coli]HEL7978448.1 phage tail protein [Escherichia coli]HEL7988075.1 phage tail protein [Escherichia coli]HEL8021146.1 phage tail protein [Escherichia coli]